MRRILKTKMKSAVNKVNWVLVKVRISNLTELNDVMHAKATHVSKLVEPNKTPNEKKEHWWNRGLEGRLKQLNRELVFVNMLLKKKKIEKKHKDRLDRK